MNAAEGCLFPPHSAQHNTFNNSTFDALATGRSKINAVTVVVAAAVVVVVAVAVVVVVVVV